MALINVQRKISVGKTCDRNVFLIFSDAGVAYLVNCKNVFIAIFAGNQKEPFVKFSYKPTAGFKDFVFQNVGDEEIGRALLVIESEDTAKAIEGIVKMEMNIEIDDNLRVDLGFDLNTKKELFNFV
jgi:hypothetical protein